MDSFVEKDLKSKRILVVDDDEKIRRVVSQFLKKKEFEVITAVDGLEGVNSYFENNPDLIILDLMLPEMDGFDVLAEVREYDTNVPVIILSVKDELKDKSRGFSLGVDDYVTKPFSPTELYMRIVAILRRTNNNEQTLTHNSQVSQENTKKKVEFDKDEDNDKAKINSSIDIVVDKNTRKVLVDGEEVKLTAKEFELLWILAKNKNKVFTREKLLQKVWQTDYVGDINTVNVMIRRLRSKIEKDPEEPGVIKTVWGVGYKVEEANKKDS
ncbi:response regulator transcription factor [Natranaerofaba carboxydovora]|uniref:response regulator transcription factor n=1 Tax=Natranaerofaba carboxydovora TaxID=2742683 RepID=UPI001F134F20|nr:response regulator transcription factor [Natranaerofaba carboxydovora]UMZ73768.1 Transcriptional regulatory protein SrrA [Natranaerofaba carboxydovora]